MYYIHRYEWEPGLFTHTRLLPGYKLKSEAITVLRSFKEKAHISYEVKEENL